ncbi:hypothetical protein CXB49_05195 [Chromobacterium sp. ATCC 53434]|uniref:hypothetical protein n=1 Tax=Chromobacterium TaxID=535 RepID=UPI000C7637F2|nr:hypothetical protein [Chromobacterium sp. ATCC 53434]AUH50258.1 hypothetical protein CXB49_05195 [Chromobacterium sp. ATCC 53434]
MANLGNSPVLDDGYMVAGHEAPAAGGGKGNPVIGWWMGAAIACCCMLGSYGLAASLALPSLLGAVAGGVTLFAVLLAATPYLRFVDHGWWTRYDEFRNQLWGEALSKYLWHFRHRRAEAAGALESWGQPAAEPQRERAACLFRTIYSEQYGRYAFVPPLLLLLAVVFFESNYIVLVPLRQVLPGGHPLLGYLSQFVHFDLQISAMCGAYMFVVGDTVNNVRKRCLNVADVYWYALRMALAVPIAYAVTLVLPKDAAVSVAFALGALPIDTIIKMLRRLVNAKLNTGEAEQPDQLVKLDGVTTAVASQLEAEGVSSIDQLLGMDPVLLAVNTGLSFKFVLRLVGQAIVRRHLGDAAFSLSAIGLADATSVYCLMQDLKRARRQGGADSAAEAIMADACRLLQSVSKSAWPDRQTVEFAFGNIADYAYTGLLMSAGFERAEKPAR